MIKSIREWFMQVLRSISPGGPSTTKIIFLSTGFAGLIAAMAMSLSLCVAYLWKGVANDAFAAATASVWVVAYGFVSGVQNKKNAADKDIQLRRPSTPAPADPPTVCPTCSSKV